MDPAASAAAAAAAGQQRRRLLAAEQPAVAAEEDLAVMSPAQQAAVVETAYCDYKPLHTRAQQQTVLQCLQKQQYSLPILLPRNTERFLLCHRRNR